MHSTKPGASQVFAWHLFLHSSWSFSVGGGQAFSALPPEVQPPKKTGVLRFLLLNPGDRTVPSPWRHFHTAQPFGGEQPRAHAPPQAHAPHSRKPQTHAFCPPHFQIPAPAGVGPLHTQNIACARGSSSLCNAIIEPTCPVCHHLMQYCIPDNFGLKGTVTSKPLWEKMQRPLRTPTFLTLQHPGLEAASWFKMRIQIVDINVLKGLHQDSMVTTCSCGIVTLGLPQWTDRDFRAWGKRQCTYSCLPSLKRKKKSLCKCVCARGDLWCLATYGDFPLGSYSALNSCVRSLSQELRSWEGFTAAYPLHSPSCSTSIATCVSRTNCISWSPVALLLLGNYFSLFPLHIIT